MTPITDFHCDLLWYLAGEQRDPFSPASRCSLPLLEQGHVTLQTLAIYCRTAPGSHNLALRQLECFKKMPKCATQFVAAIENASGLLEEGEDLALLFERLSQFPPLAYISLTWNDENRFGGGNATTIGLKKDGEALLEHISGKGIAIDLSHTSDALAHDILNFIDKQGLRLTPIASHSNFRPICNAARNLPDEIAKEIIRRNGVIGLNFVRKFVGDPFVPKMMEMIEHASKLQLLDHLVFGADFFYTGDLVNTSLNDTSTFFVEEFGNSSCYPRLLSHVREHFGNEIAEKIAHKNAANFFSRERVHAPCR